MTARKASDPGRELSPIRVAPLGELNAYMVHEHELDIIAAGSPATLAFNFAVALVSIGISFVLTLTTTTISSGRLFIVYVNVCMNCLLAGLIMFAYWLKTLSSVSHTVAEIKSRMVALTLVQQSSSIDSTTES